MMKFFLVIFSFYFTYLAAIPCGDNGNCNEFADTHETGASTNQSNKHERDKCSPFCICACCSCQVYNLKSFASFTNLYTQTVERKIIPYQSGLISQFVVNIWQPPKV